MFQVYDQENLFAKFQNSKFVVYEQKGVGVVMFHPDVD